MADSHPGPASERAAGAQAGPSSAQSMLSGSGVRVLLQALQRTAGPQYELLLQAAGLPELLVALPPDGPEPALSRSRLVRLNQTVFQMLGEGLTRLFYRNLGTAQAQIFARTPLAQQAAAQIATMPTAEQYEWVVRRLLAVAVRGWNAQPPDEHAAPWYQISEDAGAWYLTTADCTACAGVRGATAPLCSWVPALFSGLARIYGQHVAVNEVECAAMGAPHCRFAVDKRPDFPR